MMPLDIDHLPVLGICGASGSGKTTLIEQCLHRLRVQGLRVAVAKHCQKSLALDQPGKDSARFFAAGADLLMMGENGIFVRRRPAAKTDFTTELLTLAAHYDLVLIEGYRHTPGIKVWLASDDETSPPPTAGQTLAILTREQDRATAMATLIDDFLAQQWRRPMVLGCILIGGKSSRMGRAKHLLSTDGATWLQRTADCLATVCQQVVVAGLGDMADCTLPRLPDAPGVQGPLAGLLSVMRWQPWATVLACACDLPDMSADALHWLLAQRSAGAWAVIPKVGAHHEPLLALYDFRIRPTLEGMAQAGIHRLTTLIGADGVRVLSPPSALHGAWRNVNTPEML